MKARSTSKAMACSSVLRGSDKEKVLETLRKGLLGTVQGYWPTAGLRMELSGKRRLGGRIQIPGRRIHGGADRASGPSAKPGFRASASDAGAGK